MVRLLLKIHDRIGESCMLTCKSIRKNYDMKRQCKREVNVEDTYLYCKVTEQLLPLHFLFFKTRFCSSANKKCSVDRVVNLENCIESCCLAR